MKHNDRSNKELTSESVILRKPVQGIKDSENRSMKRDLNSNLEEQVKELSKKNRYQTIINTVTRSVHQSINLQEVLENAVEAVNKNIEGVDNVGIYLVERNEAVIKAYRGYHEKFIRKLRRIPYPKGFIWKTIMEAKPRYCEDAEKDQVIGQIGKDAGTKSYVSMPVCSEGKAVGAIGISSFMKTNAFSEDELSLLESVAQQIEVAINNARQADKLRSSEEALRKTKQELKLRVKQRTAELLRTNELLRQEIAERKRIERSLRKTKEALEESEALFRTLFENAPEVIVVFDADSRRFTDVNEQAVRLLGYTKDEFRNLGWEDISPPHMNLEIGRKFEEQALSGGTPVFEWPCVTSSGGVIIGEVRLLSLPKSGQRLVRCSMTDVSERKRAEQRIKTALKEKEVLLMEIQHRVKNNLQVISSLIDLQSKTIKNKQALKLFEETHNRIKSMALIQQQFYQTKNLAEIDFAEYLKNLCASLSHSYGVKKRSISLDINVKNISLGVNTAITLGLMINEIMSNSLKHAFPDQKEGVIRIDLTKNGNSYRLIISDNGVGLPNDLDLRNIDSLGLKLVNALTKQLEGTIKLSRNRGTAFTIRFSGID